MPKLNSKNILPVEAVENNLLSHVKGYKQVMEHKQKLENTGTDFSENKGAVAKSIGKLHPKYLELKVSEIIENTPSTKTFRLISATGPLPKFQAGQYISLDVNINGIKTSRPYTISSSPATRDYYDLTIKRVVTGFVSKYLFDHIKVDHSFQSSSPTGNFYHNPLFHGQDLVFLAAGSGIAPAISMIREIADNHSPYHFNLIYTSSYTGDVIFENELDRLEQKHQFLTVTRVITRPKKGYKGYSGHLTATLINKLIDTVKNKMFYICGSTPFNEFCNKQLLELNIKPRRIKFERNGAKKRENKLEQLSDPIETTQEVTIKISGSGSFKAKVDEPLLNSMERNGYSTKNSCRSGQCSLCRVKVLHGTVSNAKEANLRETDAQYGWCHSCVAFPNENIEIMI